MSEMRSPFEPLGSFDASATAPVQLLDRLQTAAAAGAAGCSGPVAEDGRGSNGR
jgi:hypothetical protein